ncbi:putative Peroxidase 21 precursor [Hibiscus syriacus]|uniref:Peroxidase 21 n=1 Tax=Hibiscus syriacus TaxID=106335 RepID=A0A6A3BVZ0_HIBSY|nr:putative Peroxidase 21 precursor [Hibiscus syriacus]
MDRLWFQQNILFPENQLEPKQPYSESTTTTSSSLSSLSLSSVADQQEPAPEEQVKKRSRKRNHSRSHSSSSSSPPAQKRDKRMNNQCKLRKSTMNITGGDDIGQEEKKRVVIRPYFSEAWLIKRPDSPLLNQRVPRVSAVADMKKHLKFWARTVASVVQQE